MLSAVARGDRSLPAISTAVAALGYAMAASVLASVGRLSEPGATRAQARSSVHLSASAAGRTPPDRPKRASGGRRRRRSRIARRGRGIRGDGSVDERTPCPASCRVGGLLTARTLPPEISTPKGGQWTLNARLSVEGDLRALGQRAKPIACDRALVSWATGARLADLGRAAPPSSRE
jgi:hypothetical protein